MKPIIIIKEKNAKGKFEFTENELKELIEQAYAQGVADEKKTQPSIQYKPTEWDNGKRDMTTIGYPHDIYGYPTPYCGADTISDPKDNMAVPNTTLNDLVNRIREHNDKLSKQGAIPCYDTPVTCGTTSQNTLT